MKLLHMLSSQGALLAAAGLVVASSAVVGTGGTLAGFQATTSNAGNVFNSGIIRMANQAGTAVNSTTNTACAPGTSGFGVLSGTCAQVFNPTLRVIGDSSQNTIEITNTGTADGLLSLALGTVVPGNASSAGDAPTCDTANYKKAIAVAVSDGSTTLSSGSLDAFNGFSGVLVSPGASGKKTYTVKLTFNSVSGVTDNNLQNCAASFPLSWTLDQRAASSSTAGS